MRKGIFSKLAVQNIRNNKSTYIPYMITCIFCIAMIYMMEFLRDCPTLDQAVRHAAEVRMILSTGEVLLEGKNIVHLTEKEISAFRRQNLGFVFQDFNLLDTFSLRDNIYLPLVLAGEDYREMEQKIRPIAQALRITELLDKFPYEVSGGQKQRAAVARALITDPRLILADEPTGALDSRAASALLTMFGQINREGQTILMVTHSAQAASHASRVLFIKDGEVFHQIYKGSKNNQEMYQMISDTLTILTTGGDHHA